jgi:hypothetical protein
MYTYQAAELFLLENKTQLMELFNLDEDRITISLASLPPRTLGTCAMNVNYSLATIEIDPIQHFSEEHFLETCEHELWHLVLSSFELYKESTEENYDFTKNNLWSYAREQTIISLQNIAKRFREQNAALKTELESLLREKRK